MQFIDEILVPRTRVAVVIGPKGATKVTLEQLGNVKITVKNNLVEVEGTDALEVMIAKNVVDAVGRGFSPESAKLLFKEDYAYEKLSLPDYGHKKQSHQQRVRGVVIGANGKAKNLIARETGAEIVVQGKTVAILGKYDAVEKARQAVEMLLTGRRHATVYRFLSGGKGSARPSQEELGLGLER
ncbi:MAG: RNA-processing protein [DPANN group archaeon]|nr:RNA-processing protein [DPANN group archaeon]